MSMIRRLIIFGLFIGLLATLYVVSQHYFSMEAMVEQEAELRRWMRRNSWSAFGLGFLIYIIVSLVPGLAGKAIIVGWFYGFWQALVIVNVGLTITAVIGLWVSRYICRDFVTRRYGRRLAKVNRALEREGAGYLFAARVLHVPFSLTNYVLGATHIRLSSFWWATQLGLLPGNIVFVYAGSQAPTLQEIAEQGLASLLSPGLIIAFIAMSILPLLLRAIVRRMLLRFRGEGREDANNV